MAVAGDDVSGPGHGAADEVPRPKGDFDAFVRIGQRGGANDIRADEVALDLIIVAAGDENAVAGVARNEIARTRRGAADGVARSTAVDLHAVTHIAQSGRPRRIRADIVAGDDVARGGRAGDFNPRTRVARNHVPRAGGSSADGVVRSAGDQDAVEAIGPGRAPGGVQADVVPFDDVARRTRFQPHAPVGIAGNDVALGGGRPADDGIGRIGEHDSRAVGRRRVIGPKSEIVGLDDRPVDACDLNAVAPGKAVDGKALDRHVVRGNVESVIRVRSSLELDQRRARVTGLTCPVDDHGIGDRRQRRGHVDRLRAAAGDVEIDRDRRRARGVVGGGDRLAQRDVTVGARIGDQRADGRGVAVGGVGRRIHRDRRRRRSGEHRHRDDGPVVRTGFAPGHRDRGCADSDNFRRRVHRLRRCR